MNKFMNRGAIVTEIRLRLLATVSAMALLGSAATQAADADRPQIWIELGGQLSRLDNSQEVFAPPLMDGRPSIFQPSQKFEKPPLYGFDEDGKISFQPENSDWVFSAAIRYGRSASHHNFSQQTTPPTFDKYYSGAHHPRHLNVDRFASTIAQNSENHFILDFQVGKDVGLGIFGAGGSSTINLGVRFAQFHSKSNIVLGSDPDAQPTFKYAYGIKFLAGGHYHTNAASLKAARSFHGLGPSISWNASAPIAGTPQDGEIALDWGANAALLFGRQRAKVHHQTTSRYHKGKYNNYNFQTTVSRNTPPDQNRSRSVTVPNVGGFAGLSFRYSDAKLSLGYRADFFFGAVDGGIDSRKSENRGFFGPFASISVGLGD